LKRELKQDSIIIDNYEIDCDSKLVYRDTQLVDIAPKAVAILLLLINSKHKVITTDEIEDSVWSSSKSPSSGTLRVYISQLNRYFDKHIENIRGVGYRWID
jgi:two-component system response regulator MprA